MTKYFKIVFLVVICVIIWWWLYQFVLNVEQQNAPEPIIPIESSWSIDVMTGALQWESVESDKKEEQLSDAASSKYASLNDNILYKESIELWDSFFVEDKLIAALQNYQKAKKIRPDDKELDIRLWDVYFELKNYSLAYKHFKWNDAIAWFSKDKEILSLFYKHYELTDTDIDEITNEVKQLNFNVEQRIYYLNSLECASDFSQCKKFYQDYFASAANSEIKLPELVKLKEWIEAYYNSGMDDINFKNALVIGKFFENRHYAMVIKLWNDLLQDFPEYDPVIQMIWKSYYELWEYDKANDILWPHHEKNLTDEKLSYFLWVISIKRRYFLSSNIYFYKALESWYEPKIDVKRKLVYNYFLLWNKEKMYLMLDELLYEEGVDVSDFSLGIYQAVNDKKSEKALEYTKKWAEVFPEEAKFYGYMIDIYLQQWKIEQAKQAAEVWKEINPKSIPVIYYEWLIRLQERDLNNAFLSFRRVISLWKWEGEFPELAEEKLKEIQKLRSN